MCVFAYVYASVCVRAVRECECVPLFFVPFHLVMYCIVYYIFIHEKNKIKRKQKKVRSYECA